MEKIKLTGSDKQYLVSIGHVESDFIQIEQAIGYITYTINGKRISRKKAIEKLGRNAWLSGVARSAFHWSGVRITDDGTEIGFDASRFFRRN